MTDARWLTDALNVLRTAPMLNAVPIAAVEKARAILTAAQGESGCGKPVDWQRRFKHSTTGEWTEWERSRHSEEEFRYKFGYLLENGEAEIRYLYAAPRPLDPAYPSWHSMDTAPKDGTEILGWWCGGKTHTIIAWSSDGWWKDSADDSMVSAPTHWQPLQDGPSLPSTHLSPGADK